MRGPASGHAPWRERPRRGANERARARSHRWSSPARPRTLRRSRAPPAASIACDERVRLFRSPCAGGVGLELLPAGMPALEDRVDEGPLLLHLVAAREERRVAAERIE